MNWFDANWHQSDTKSWPHGYIPWGHFLVFVFVTTCYSLRLYLRGFSDKALLFATTACRHKATIHKKVLSRRPEQAIFWYDRNICRLFRTAVNGRLWWAFTDQKRSMGLQPIFGSYLRCCFSREYLEGPSPTEPAGSFHLSGKVRHDNWGGGAGICRREPEQSSSRCCFQSLLQQISCGLS